MFDFLIYLLKLFFTLLFFFFAVSFLVLYCLVKYSEDCISKPVTDNEYKEFLEFIDDYNLKK